MEQLDLDAVQWALGDGREILEETIADPADEFRTASRLRGGGLSQNRRSAIMDLAKGSRRARAAGLPTDSYWTTSSAEQASHPSVAAWRSQRYADASVTDVTAGCGGDTLALRDVASLVQAVEIDPVRATLLRHNLGPGVKVSEADVTRHRLTTRAWWADPGRRSGTRRLRRLSEVLPPVTQLIEHLGAEAGGVAVSPGVDLTDPDLPTTCELEFVQVGRDLVEATIWLGELRQSDKAGWRSATILPSGDHVSGTEPGERLDRSDVLRYLLEPAPALVRARLHEVIGQEIGATSISHRRALLTSDQPPTDDTWFRTWDVKAVTSIRPKRVRAVLEALDVDLPVELALHGVVVDPEKWLAELGRVRGPQGWRIHLIRRERDSIAVVAGEVPRRLTGAT